MRGRRWVHTWWVAAIAIVCVTCGAALLSGAYTWGHYFDNRHLISLGEGELELWVLVDAGMDDGGLQDVFADYYFPRPWPADGLMRNRAFSLYRRWPTLCMESHRGVGTWWEFRMPLWTGAAGILALGAMSQVRAVRRRRQPAEQPRWSTAGRVTLALSLAGSVLILTTWILNTSWYFGGNNGLHAIEVERSALIFCTIEDLVDGPDDDAPDDAENTEPDTEWSWHWDPQPAAWHWELPHLEENTMACMEIWRELVFPLWTLFLLAAAPAALLLWRHRRRPRPGHCRKCDYDLTGNVSGRCPECGTTCSRR